MRRVVLLCLLVMAVVGCASTSDGEEAKQYLTFVDQQAAQLSEGFQEISALSDIPASRLFAVDQWRGDMYRATGKIRDAATAVIEYENVPPAYEVVHQEFVEAAQLCLAGITLYEDGVEQQDDGLLQAGSEAFTQARLRLQQMFTALEEVDEGSS